MSARPKSVAMPSAQSARPARRLCDLAVNPLRCLSRTAEKAAIRDLSEIAREHPDLHSLIDAHPVMRDFVIAVFTLSPYLRDLARQDPEALTAALETPLDELLAGLVDRAGKAWRNDAGESGAGVPATVVSETMVMSALRRIKRRAALALALGDLSRILDARETTLLLSRLAEASVSGAVNFCLWALAEQGKVRLLDPDDPSSGSGLIVLGMGKLGARELNYSSDIDLVLFFDPSAGLTLDPVEAGDLFSRLARRLVRIMQERTVDGYVFRTDLRLRPDPGSTPLAIPVEAALNYYEGRGQNWERAAFIKARPIAGDIAAGKAFVRELTPFIFRKYLDYAAIADIHSIKRQIHAHKGHGEIAILGHNIKLGRGGIREIEFFVQTQQLIAGGRLPDVRARRTDDALAALAEARWISEKARTALEASYWYLRDVEHRIQMVHDEQSHVLPDRQADLKRIALMMGEKDSAHFCVRLEKVLKTVEGFYAGLFEHEESLASASGNLVFTGSADDPDTVRTLAALGFERPDDIAKLLKTWHYGRYRATQSRQARERLTEIAPRLLAAFGETRRADEALLRFDAFLAGLPAGIQLFALLANNPRLLKLLVTIMAAAPRLAEIIARKPHVFDGMLDPGLMSELPTRDYLSRRVERFLEGEEAYEGILDRLRIIAAEQKFLIGIRLLTGAISGARCAEALSDLADLIVDKTLAAVESEVRRLHGVVAGGRVSLLAMGKLGSREMTAGSDLDLILLYDHDDDAFESDGAKPIDPMRYYARLTQRLVAALSAPTAEGVLYDVDLRLRPSGNKGPIATRISAFRKYQATEAWTWEHMALTRARIVSGDASLGDEAEAVIRAVLEQGRDPVKIAGDIAEMRGMIADNKQPSGPFDTKLIAGGLVDIEFIAQFLALTGPAGLIVGQTRITSTTDMLLALGPASLGREETHRLVHALRLFSDVAQIIRLCMEGEFDPQTAPVGLRELVADIADSPDIAELTARMADMAREVRSIFTATIGPIPREPAVGHKDKRQ